MHRACQIVIGGLRVLALSVVLGLSIVLILGVWTLYSQGIRLLAVQTGSMTPEIKVDDAVVVQRQSFDKLRKGQVISFHAKNGPLVSHRINSINYRTHSLVTQGDQNSQPDGVVNDSQIVGEVIYLMPKLGRVANFLHRPLGLVTVVYLPATACIVWQLRILQERIKPSYRLQQ